MKLQFNFFCRDIDAQLRFYRGVTGLPEVAQVRSPIYCAMGDAGIQFGFHAQAAYELLGLQERAPMDLPPLPVCGYPTFLLDTPGQVSDAAAQAAALGGRVIKAPYPTYYGQWQSVLADPEDNVFRVTAQGLPAGVAAPVLAL